MVVLLQMTYLGAPMVYYGDEAGMWGGDDPCDRMPMVWDDLAVTNRRPPTARAGRATADAVAFDRELFEFYRDAIALRREHAGAAARQFETGRKRRRRQVFRVPPRRSSGKSIYVAFNRGEAGRLHLEAPGRGRGLKVAACD